MDHESDYDHVSRWSHTTCMWNCESFKRQNKVTGNTFWPRQGITYLDVVRLSIEHLLNFVQEEIKSLSRPIRGVRNTNVLVCESCYAFNYTIVFSYCECLLYGYAFVKDHIKIMWLTIHDNTWITSFIFHRRLFIYHF